MNSLQRGPQDIKESEEQLTALSAEVKALQQEREVLQEEVARLLNLLQEEESAKLTFRARTARAEAIADLLRQTAGQVLQPLASAMIVVEDLVEIAEDVGSAWQADQPLDDLLYELEQGLARVNEVYPEASRVLAGYRELFQVVEAEKLAAVDRLSFGVAHDIRNTLATAINSGIPLRRLMVDLQQVMGMVQAGQPAGEIDDYLQRRKLPQRLGNAPELYETMMSSLGRALDNVKALEGHGTQDDSDFQEIRIEDVIQQVLREHRQDLEGIRVVTSLEEGAYTFHGSPLRLYDLFQNLVLNAVEAMGGVEEPTLEIATQVNRGVHHTTVADNGCGMSQEVREHAFEPFYTTKELVEGRQRGLGLFNVWRLVNLHSGKVEIESELSAYTRFLIQFDVDT